MVSLREIFTPDNLSSAVDTALAIFNPEAALKRAKTRTALTQVRLFDGATKGRRGDGFRPIADGPRESTKGLSVLRQRSRDFSRNNGYASKAVSAITANTIGTGIVLNIKAKRKNGTSNLSDLWKKWSESTACDFNGLTTFSGLQELAFKTMVESGEVFIRKRVESSSYYKKTKQIPLKLQILEPEFLDDSKDTTGGPGQNQIISGIEYNADDERVAYHMFRRHPSFGGFVESVRVKAEEVIHLYRLDRPGQVRGVPWGASVMLNLHDLDGYEDAELLRRKIAACFAAFITQPEIDDTVAAQTEIDTYIDRMEPGLIEVLPAGKTVTFGSPPQVNGYAEYSTSLLHKIAAGYQVPYSVLTGDFSQVNFSSGRMGWLEFQRLIEQWRWNIFIPRALNPIWSWFTQLAEILTGASDNVTAEWTAPRREMIDPGKEIEAILESVKHGLTSMPEAIRELGYDPDAVLEQIKDWNAKLDAASIVLDSDPRKDAKRLTAENVAKIPKAV